MTQRATKRGAERTLLSGEWDVVVCGASFAGLAAARELRGTGARVLVLDRYEIGERQTSACAAPTEWLANLGVGDSIRQTFETLLFHTASVTARWPLPWSYSTFDYPQLCRLLWEQCEAEFETAKVDGRTREGRTHVIHTDRGDLRAPLVVDALGWRRVLGAGDNVQPPGAPLSRGLEVHPGASGEDLTIWVDPSYLSSGYAWAFPARDEVRVGVGSYDPRHGVKDPTLALARDVGVPPDGYQGNWIPHRLRPAVEDGVFFAGDSAGHCLPLTAEGIRTAFYFGLACGRELRAVVEGRQHVTTALQRYAEFSDARQYPFSLMLGAQRSIRHVHGRVLDRFVRWFERPAVVNAVFSRYLAIAPPSYALARGQRAG